MVAEPSAGSTGGRTLITQFVDMKQGLLLVQICHFLAVNESSEITIQDLLKHAVWWCDYVE
ncbi:MAG: hypothetical protein ACI9E1_000400 [Cryomorphaceae bacterium]|jgi:hypothetical protein